MRTIRGQVGMTTCDVGFRRVCSTTIACKVRDASGEEHPDNCPEGTQYAGDYVRLMTENCKCDAVASADGSVGNREI